LVALGIGATLSRSVWLGLLAGLGVLLLDRSWRRRAPAGAALLLVALGAFAAVDWHGVRARATSFSFHALDPGGFRVELWRRAARIIVDHPLTGSGRFDEL